MAEPLRLYGLNALVLNAGSGIGEATARTLIKHGATVIAVDTTNSGVERHFAAVKGITGLAANLVDPDQMPALVREAAQATYVEGKRFYLRRCNSQSGLDLVDLPRRRIAQELESQVNAFRAYPADAPGRHPGGCGLPSGPGRVGTRLGDRRRSGDCGQAGRWYRRLRRRL